MSDNDGVLVLHNPHVSGITEGQKLGFQVKSHFSMGTLVFKYTRTGDFFDPSPNPPKETESKWGRYRYFVNDWLRGDRTDKVAFKHTFDTGVGGGGLPLGFTSANDSIDEPDGTLTASFDYSHGRTPNSIRIPIRDDDPTVVSLARTSLGAVSTGEAVAFTVTLGRALVKGEVIDVPLAISGKGLSTDDYTLSVKSGPGATLSETNTLTPILRFSNAGAQAAPLELRPTASNTAEQYRIALGPDGAGANGFDRTSLGTNMGGGADPGGTNNGFSMNVGPRPSPRALAPRRATEM